MIKGLVNGNLHYMHCIIISTFLDKKIFLVWALILKAITACAKNGLACETSDNSDTQN